jgi:hypothetical protein
MQQCGDMRDNRLVYRQQRQQVNVRWELGHTAHTDLNMTRNVAMNRTANIFLMSFDDFRNEN